MSNNTHVPIISEADLPLSDRQVEILRQSQAYLELANSNSTSASAPHSLASSSRRASRHSSNGVLHLDNSAMALLGQHFDSMMAQVRAQMNQLEMYIADSTAIQQGSAELAMVDADDEIQRLQGYMQRMDELDNDFDEIASLRDIIKGNRQRIALLAKQLDETEEDGGRGKRMGGSSSKKKGSSRRRR